MTTSYDARRADWLIVLGVGIYLCMTRAELKLGILIFMMVVFACVFGVAKSRLSTKTTWLVAVVLMFGLLNSWRATNDYHRTNIGQYSGIAKIASDPRNIGPATRVTLEIESDRFVVYAYGRQAWRLAGCKMGEQVFVRGYRERFDNQSESHWRAQHIKGNFRVEFVGEDRFLSSPLMRSAERVRKLINKGAQSLGFAERSLFTGLVIGDDTQQSDSMIAAFRDSGLAHLVAVSGQNVSFLLAAISPLVSRLHSRNRVLLVLVLLAWFVVITRVEPSVVRAATMAGLAYLTNSIGRPTRTLRLIALTVLLNLMLDPLLAWSIGFFMSVGATLGLCLGAEWMSQVIRRPKWLGQLVGATISAQLGVMPVVIFVFGLPSATGIIANVLAVPVAGVVMLFGLPLSLVAGLIVDLGLEKLAIALMWPIRIGVWWVWWVAKNFAALRFDGLSNLMLWVAVLALIVSVRHRSSSV